METAFGIIAALAIIWFSIYRKQKDRTDTLDRGEAYLDRDNARFELPGERKVDSAVGETAKDFVGGILFFVVIGLILTAIISALS